MSRRNPEQKHVDLTQQRTRDTTKRIDAFLKADYSHDKTRKGDDRVIGVWLMGRGVDEMIQTLSIAVKMGVSKVEVDAVNAIHPTASEEIVLMKPHK